MENLLGIIDFMIFLPLTGDLISLGCYWRNNQQSGYLKILTFLTFAEYLTIVVIGFGLLFVLLLNNNLITVAFGLILVAFKSLTGDLRQRLSRTVLIFKKKPICEAAYCGVYNNKGIIQAHGNFSSRIRGIVANGDKFDGGAKS